MNRINKVLIYRKPLVIRYRKDYFSLFSWQIPQHWLRIAIDWEWLCRNLPLRDFWTAEYARWRAWSLYYFFLLPPFLMANLEKILILKGQLSSEGIGFLTTHAISLGSFLVIRFLLIGVHRLSPSWAKKLSIALQTLMVTLFFSSLFYKWYL